MGIVILTSTAGSPGVTTLAVGLALAWPRAVLLADCDPGAHQSVLAGYLAGQSANGKGLLRVAEAHRDGRPLRDVVLDQSIDLTCDPGPRRIFLPGFQKPGSAGLFGPVWPELSEAFDHLQDAGMDVLVDAGRLTSHGLPAPLRERAAVTGLVLRSNLRSVMSARVHAATFTEQAPDGGARSPAGLFVVGEGASYDKTEIARALGMPVLATLALDPGSAQHLSDGRLRPRKFESSPLARTLHTTAANLQSILQRSSLRVAG